MQVKSGRLAGFSAFADLSACSHAQTGEIAEQGLQERIEESGRSPENGGKNSENSLPREKRGMADFPKKE